MWVETFQSVFKVFSYFRSSWIKISMLFAAVSPAFSVVITCKFEDQHWNVVGSRYTCHVEEVQDSETVVVTQIIGIHMSGRSHEDVKGFNTIHQNAFTTFPKGLNDFFCKFRCNSNIVHYNNIDFFCWLFVVVKLDLFRRFLQ